LLDSLLQEIGGFHGNVGIVYKVSEL